MEGVSYSMGPCLTFDDAKSHLNKKEHKRMAMILKLCAHLLNIGIQTDQHLHFKIMYNFEMDV
jgi:hypothetical protein